MNQEFFSKKQNLFDKWAPFYDFFWTTIVYQTFHKRMLEYVELPESSKVLDLGCGSGRLLNRLGKKYPHLRGIGLDLSQEMLKVARKKAKQGTRLIYIQGNAESLPFAEGQFDAVFNTISFLHYPNPEQVLSEISRVLKIGGYFYLVDYTVREELTKFPVTPGGLRFYSKNKREKMGKQVGLQWENHYYLINNVLLSIFKKE